MLFGKYLTLFTTSTFKFMFAPFIGPSLKLSFIETYLSCVIGAILSASVFFFLSEFFILRSLKKQNEKIEKYKAEGKELPQKKQFTWLNKLVVNIKMKFGIYGVCLFAPLFLSIPGGTIIATKFYGKNKKCFPLIILGILVNGAITTGLAYLIAASVK